MAVAPAATTVMCAAVVRDAIDTALPADAASKRAAWRQIRSLPLVPMGDPDEFAAELDEIRGGGR